MSSLLLIRHSIPATDACVAAAQWPLSEAGRQRCGPLARALAAYQPLRLYASREAKAAETAALVARALGIEFAVRPNLHEHARTSVPWLPAEEFQAGVEALFARPTEVVFGDESAEQARNRFEAAVRGLLTEQPEGNIAVVTHGTVLSLFAGRAAGLAPLRVLQQLGLPAFVALDRATLALERIVGEVDGDPANVG